MLQSANFPPSFHRVTIKALVVRDRKILLVKESDRLSNKWELPGGGLHFGEEIHTCLKREVEEEMGVMVRSVENRPMYVWPWLHENDRGLDWYFSFVVGFKVELVSFNINPSEECVDVEFFSKQDLLTLDLCGQTNGLRNVFDPTDFE